MKELIGKSKLTDVLPLLKTIANKNGLKIYLHRDFIKACKILETEFKVNKIVW